MRVGVAAVSVAPTMTGMGCFLIEIGEDGMLGVHRIEAALQIGVLHV